MALGEKGRGVLKKKRRREGRGESPVVACDSVIELIPTDPKRGAEGGGTRGRGDRKRASIDKS